MIATVYLDEDKIISRLLLLEAVQRLQPKYAAVIALRSAGYSQQECGVILGVTRAAIGFIQKRAIKEIRKILEVLNDDSAT